MSRGDFDSQIDGGKVNASSPSVGTVETGTCFCSASCFTGETRILRAPHACRTSGGVSTCIDRQTPVLPRSRSNAAHANASEPQNSTSYGGALGGAKELVQYRRVL